MDGTQVIYDSDAGTNGATHNVYELATGLTAAAQPAVPHRSRRELASERFGAEYARTLSADRGTPWKAR
jgi:hypothetical protein